MHSSDATKISDTPKIKNSVQFWLRLLLISLLLLGLFCRVANLERKLYWGDEIYTSMQLSGHTVGEMQQQLATGQVIPIQELWRYQYPRPEGSAIDPIRVLAIEDSQHVPLYYVTLWAWVRFWGNSIAAIRSLSVLFSILALPCIYWLGRELFRSRWTAGLATALISISPFHLLYAQEARPYSLFSLMTILGSATFLRAVRLRTPASWALYAVTVILGLYSHIFFSIVVVSHGIYLLAMARWRLEKPLLSYVTATGVGLLCFSPWIWVILHAPSEIQAKGWANEKQEPLSTLFRWSGIVSRSFLDFGIGPESDRTQQFAMIPGILALFCLLGYALWFLYRYSPPRISFFILALIGATGFVLAIPDFGFGLRYATTRFMTAVIVGFQLAVTYLLAAKLQIFSYKRQARGWFVAICLLLATATFSGLLITNAQLWWNKGLAHNLYTPAAAAVINQSERPLVVTNDGIISVQILGHLLNEKVSFLMEPPNSPRIAKIPPGFSDVFLFKSSESLRSRLMNQTASIVLDQVVEPLWKLSKVD